VVGAFFLSRARDEKNWSKPSQGDYLFLIVGHMDSIGGPEHNLKLSKRRAETVARWLIKNNHLLATDVKTIGKGSSEPVASNSTPDGRAENGRVEAVVLQKDCGLPGDRNNHRYNSES
jgi:outer membrane protein OmpA-like peptidoglycan-associated protein